MLHQTIKEQIKDALRAKDTLRLDVLRSLNAAFQNEMLSGKSAGGEYLPDDAVTTLIRKSVKQRKDSIEQFKKGGRNDLVSKEESELKILESFLPSLMPYQEVKTIVHTRIETMKAGGNFDPKNSGKIVGMMMKELAGKAEGADVKKAVEEVLTKPL